MAKDLSGKVSRDGLPPQATTSRPQVQGKSGGAGKVVQRPVRSTGKRGR